MLKPFKLINKEFVDNEWRWTYELKITFNHQPINYITITDHYQLKHQDVITNQLILNLLKFKLNNEKVNPLPDSYLLWGKDVFLWEITYQDKNYRLIFWFKNNTNNHLWIRDCYPID